MTNFVEFTIPVCPMSLQASGKRMMVRNGKPMFFKTKKATDYQKIVSLFSNPYRPDKPWDGPVCIQYIFILPRPERLNNKKTPAKLIPCEKRPDLDNLIKGTQDALQGFWNDDSQICGLVARKYYCEKNKSPRIIVGIYKVPA